MSENPNIVIDKPHYYSNNTGIWCIDISERLTPNTAQAFQYLWRWDRKDNPVSNLEKAIWFIEREINYINKQYGVPLFDKLDESQVCDIYYRMFDIYLKYMKIDEWGKNYPSNIAVSLKYLEYYGAIVSKRGWKANSEFWFYTFLLQYALNETKAFLEKVKSQNSSVEEYSVEKSTQNYYISSSITYSDDTNVSINTQRITQYVLNVRYNMINISLHNISVYTKTAPYGFTEFFVDTFDSNPSLSWLSTHE